MWPRRRRPDEDFLEELDSHVALEMKRLVEEDGLSFKDARLKALRSFGNVTVAKERFYESRRLIWVEDLKRDLRHALRSLQKNPGFAAVAVLTLGLGIGANTAIFSVVHGLLLKPLPYQDARRVVRLVMNMPAQESPTKRPLRASMGLTEAEMRDVQRESRTLERVGTATSIMRAWPGHEESARLRGSRISASLFDMLGVRPAIGRGFDGRDESAGAEEPILLSHAAWQRYLAGAPDAIGRVIALDAVLPPRVQYRYRSSASCRATSSIPIRNPSSGFRSGRRTRRALRNAARSSRNCTTVLPSKRQAPRSTACFGRCVRNRRARHINWCASERN